MSGDYPGWCCRQIAAQLSQALFTMADLHAQLTDLREENRQLKVKIGNIDIRPAKQEVLSSGLPENLVRCAPTPSTIQAQINHKPREDTFKEDFNNQPESKLQQKLNHDSAQNTCLSGVSEPISVNRPERIVLNVPFCHVPSDSVAESSQNAVLLSCGEFQCDKCDCTFPNSNLLTIHQAVHIGRSFHVCKTCNAMFLLKADLYRHWASHPNIKQHICQLCGKAYTSKNNYKLHIKTHTGVGLFPCEVCGKAFHSENHLNVHRRIHTGERPFVCQYCEKSFTQKSGLINHTRLHTGEKPFLCPSCPKAFTQKSNLNFHLSKHHPLLDGISTPAFTA